MHVQQLSSVVRRSVFRSAAFGLRERVVDHGIELGAIEDFHKRRAFGLVGNDPDGGSVLDADALAECVVGLYQGGQFLLGINHKGQCEFVVSGELLREGVQVRECLFPRWACHFRSQ